MIVRRSSELAVSAWLLASLSGRGVWGDDQSVTRGVTT